MANTCFEVGQIIEGTYNGRPFKYRALKEGVEGSGSVYGPGMDLLNNRKVFLKKYTDPGPRAEWFAPFIEYHRKLRDRINASSAAKQLIVDMDFFQNAGDRNRFWQVIEYVDNSRDLKSYLESRDTTWEQRVKFAKVFMFAMKVLHNDLRLVHGDLKPANLLLVPNGDNYRIKLIDFDRPVFLDEPEIPWAATEGYLGSPIYFSPEHVKHQRPTDKSDVFTCGIILYQLLAKEGLPFGAESITSAYSANTAPKPHFYGSFGGAGLDARIADLLYSMLDPDPDKRPTAAEVHGALISRAEPGDQPDTAQGASGVASVPLTQAIPPAQNPTESLKGAADIVFLLDATGSMGKCIGALKDHVHSFIRSLVTGDSEGGIAPVQDWRARVVGYRDFKDCNESESKAKAYTKFGKGGWLINNAFTSDENELHRQLDALKAFGGGSEPQESMLDALMLVMKSGYASSSQPGSNDAYKWRTNGAGRVVIIFTDAGYHPEMSYGPSRTRFDEKEIYTQDIEGGTLDEIQTAIESGHFKIYVFAPDIKDYEEFSELSNVMIFNNGTENGGFSSTIEDGSAFSRLIDDIVKGVSRSSSDFRDMPME